MASEVNSTEQSNNDVSPWREILPHQVFNNINNLVSSMIVDFRSKEDFEQVHISRSSHVVTDSEDTIAASINEALSKRHERTIYFQLVVLLPYTEVDSGLLSRIAGLVVSNGGTIIQDDNTSADAPAFEGTYRCSLHFMKNCQAFFSKYGNCKHFLSGSQFPIRKNTIIPYANEVVEGFLYLGDCANASDLHQHQALGITHIVDASNSRVSKTVSQSNGIEYLEIKIRDSASATIADHFETVHNFLETARANNGKALVHCMAGISRSSSLVISYLVKHQNMSLRDATTLVVNARPVVCPNEGFQAQLIVHEAVNRNENSIADPAEFDTIIQSVSKLWSQTYVTDNAFDRIPIEQLRQQQQQKMAYLQEGEPGSQENLPPNPESNNNNGDNNDPTKPPKNFLKRGEGKRATSRSGTRRPRLTPSPAPAAEKPSLSAYVEKLRSTVAGSNQEDVAVVVVVAPNSALNSADNSMLTDASALGTEDIAAAAVAEIAAEQQQQAENNTTMAPTAVEAVTTTESTLVADGVAAVDA